MQINTGYFATPETHHKGWFRVFRFSREVEVWFGHRYVMVSL